MIYEFTKWLEKKIKEYNFKKEIECEKQRQSRSFEEYMSTFLIFDKVNRKRKSIKTLRKEISASLIIHRTGENEFIVNKAHAYHKIKLGKYVHISAIKE